MKKIVIAYIPVLHQGYQLFLEKHADAQQIYILGQSLIAEFDHLRKEIRALNPKLVQKSLKAWGVKGQILLLDKDQLKKLQNDTTFKLIMPNEDMMRDFHQKYFPETQVEFDAIFLRWDKHSSTKKNLPQADLETSSKDFDQKMMTAAIQQAQLSSDWWRHVGAVIIKDSKIILAGYNHHLPSAHTPYINGDPRNDFHKGIHIELSTAIHAEAGLIAEAAKKGIKLEGSEIYVSTFPCPICARQIAQSGIKTIYFAEGYGILDAEEILKQYGIKLVLVKTEKNIQAKLTQKSTKHSLLKKYPK
jgi:dCMP deaminase